MVLQYVGESKPGKEREMLDGDEEGGMRRAAERTGARSVRKRRRRREKMRGKWCIRFDDYLERNEVVAQSEQGGIC